MIFEKKSFLSPSIFLDEVAKATFVPEPKNVQNFRRPSAAHLLRGEEDDPTIDFEKKPLSI